MTIDEIEDVKRYQNWCLVSHGHDMSEQEAGEFVKYSDYATLIAMVRQLETDKAGLVKGINAVTDLIEQSGGVYGLHLNGDGAPWNELLQGGKFEEWLIDFSEAQALAKHSGKEGDF